MYSRADNYDARSRNPHCSISGLPKLPGETGIFRLADIEFEGSFDIGEQMVRDMASDLGMVPGEKHKTLQEAYDELSKAHRDAEEDYRTLQAEYRTLELRHGRVLMDLSELEDLISEDAELLSDEEILGD